MKIIIVTSLYPPEIDNVASYTKDLAEHLSHSHQVTVLAYVGLVARPTKFNLLVVNKHWPLFFRLFVFIYKLYSLARKADIIYVQNSVAATMPAIIIKKLLKIPVIINFSEDEAYKRARRSGISNKFLADFLADNNINKQIKRIQNLQAWLLPQASKIIVPFQALGDLLEKFYKVSKDKILLNNQVLEKIETLPFAVNKSQHQIVVSGDLVDNAGIKSLLTALAKLKEDFNDIKLIIIGNGPAKASLEILSKNLKIESSVIFLGQVSGAENIYYLKNSSIYFNGSVQADFSANILLSFLVGTVVIASDINWHQEMIINGQSGFLFKLNDSQEIINKISRIFSDEQGNKNIISQAKNLADTKFSWAKHLNVLNNIFVDAKNK